jgi:hypothetical protein
MACLGRAQGLHVAALPWCLWLRARLRSGAAHVLVVPSMVCSAPTILHVLLRPCLEGVYPDMQFVGFTQAASHRLTGIWHHTSKKAQHVHATQCT